MRAWGPLLLAMTLWVSDGQVYHPVRTFTDDDACIVASWRIGLLTGRLAECRPVYRLFTS